ncbi:hypothetical protein [Brucella sp. IR073]|uniref:hypothetical protein n=1 Tax=unclassified Brucella TaxID=2632610 RepID=UPI003B982815
MAAIPVPQRIETESRHGREPVPILRLFTTRATQENYYRLARETVYLPTLRLSFDYDGKIVRDGPGGEERFLENGKAITLLRDENAERRAFDRLLDAGAEFAEDIMEMPDRSAGKTDLYFSLDETMLSIGEMMADEVEIFGYSAPQTGALRFMTRTLPALRREGWRIEIAEDWPYKVYDGPVEINGITESQGGASGNWFSMGVRLQVGEGELDLLPIIRQLLEQLAFLNPDAPDWDDQVSAILEELTLFPQLEDGRFVSLEASSLIPLLRVFLSAIGLLDGFHPAEAGRAFQLVEALKAAAFLSKPVRNCALWGKSCRRSARIRKSTRRACSG